jgi:3-deoxy-D-manno-octulosonate 8-phosphate phosphatase (KDO 8-P phosphatase)
VYEQLLAGHGLEDKDVFYMGDDLIDLPVMRRAGFSAAPADAHPEVLATADFVSSAKGGQGAVREAIEEILKAAGEWERVVESFDR